MASKIRVVIAKPGLDGHDRGAKIIARALRDAGMEVIYTGLHQTPEQIVETAIQEDADAVGISILSGAHMTLVPRILDLLRENGAEDVLVVVGGTIPAEDVDELKAQGVAAVFTPGRADERDRRLPARRRYLSSSLSTPIAPAAPSRARRRVAGCGPVQTPHPVARQRRRRADGRCRARAGDERLVGQRHGQRPLELRQLLVRGPLA